MKKLCYLILFFSYFNFVLCVNFTGLYKITKGNVDLQLQLNVNGSSITGVLKGGTSAKFQLSGNINGDYAFGTCFGNGAKVFFNLFFENSTLYLQLIEPASNGEPDWTKIKELTFSKTSTYTQSTTTNKFNPLAKTNSNNFNGKFSGEGLIIVLKQNGNSVNGKMEFLGTKYTLSGKVNGNRLKGVFSSANGQFNFIASKNGSNLNFETEGNMYHLKGKRSVENPLAKKSNPLARGKSNPSSNSYNNSTSKLNSNSSSRIKVDSMGLSFIPPNGWICKKDPKSGNYIMGSNSIPGFMFILPHSYSSLNELVNNSSQGFTEEGISLYPTGQVEYLDNSSVGSFFEGTFKGVQAKAYVVGAVSPNGGGLLGLCITESSKFSENHRKSAIDLVKSVKFYKPKVDTQLMSYLSGKYYSYSGSTERQLALCQNGVFYDSSESSYSGKFSNQYGSDLGAWGSASSGNGSGKWKAIGNKQTGTIYFYYKNGGENEQQYQVTNSAFYLGGVKYGFNGKANCR